MEFKQDHELHQRSNVESIDNIPDEAAWLEVGFATDPGKSGKPNQDYYGIIETVYTLGQQAQAETPIVVGVVADGISSNSSSDVAGQIVVETIRRVLVENPSIPIKPRLDAAIRRANKEVFQATQEIPQYAGTGATLVAAAFAADQLYVAHLGDSRAYVVRNRQMHLLTVDHRWGQEAVDAGEMTPEEAMAHPDRNLITRLIGISSNIEVDHHIVDIEKSSLDLNRFQRWPLIDRMWMQPGDIVLLCSDGLSDVLSPQQIEAVINRHPPQAAAQRLVEMVNSAGGPDNVTVLLFKLPAPKAHSQEWAASVAAEKQPSQAPNYFLRTITLLLLVAALVSGLWLIVTRLPLPFELSLPPLGFLAQQDNETEENVQPAPSQDAAPEAAATEAPIATAEPLATAVDAAVDTVEAPDAESTEAPTTESEVPAEAQVELAEIPATDGAENSTDGAATDVTSELPVTETVEAAPATPLTEHALSIVQPADGTEIAGIQRFEWQDSAGLAENESYEMLIWPATEERSTARGIAGLSQEKSRIINLNSVGLTPGSYQWGVRIVSLDDGSEVAYLGNDAMFVYAP